MEDKSHTVWVAVRSTPDKLFGSRSGGAKVRHAPGALFQGMTLITSRQEIHLLIGGPKAINWPENIAWRVSKLEWVCYAQQRFKISCVWHTTLHCKVSGIADHTPGCSTHPVRGDLNSFGKQGAVTKFIRTYLYLAGGPLDTEDKPDRTSKNGPALLTS